MNFWKAGRLALALTFAAGLMGLVAVACNGGSAAVKKGTCENNSPENGQALQYLNQILAKDHNDGAAYLSRGRCLYFLHRYPEAMQDLNEAIRLVPTAAEAYLFRARAEKMLGDIQQAMTDYSRSIDLHPSADAYFGRGRTYQEDYDEYETALADYNAALRLDRTHIPTYKNRATVYAAKRDFQKAEQDIRSWMNLDPAVGQPHCNMGLLRYYEGKDAECQRWFKTCFEKDPDPQTRQYYEGEARIVSASRQAEMRRRSSNSAFTDDSESARQKRALDVLERSGNESGARACRNDSSAC